MTVIICSVCYTCAFLLITFCILTNSQISLAYALNGLNLWYNNMIPALMPFMILSGTLIRMGLTEGFTTLVYPVIKRIFHVSRNACYVMLMGFMCGFPMGAKCVSDLYVRGRLNREEAAYLLYFCNNIGPVYFVSFALPLIGCKRIIPCIFGMYGIPLLYGLLLRYTRFRNMYNIQNRPHPHADNRIQQSTNPHSVKLFQALDESIYSSFQSMLMLGGYMVFFNLLMLIPHMFMKELLPYVAPIMEITGGLKILGNRMPFYSLIMLPFGGLSCIAQTYSCIKDTGLSISVYVLHKVILTAIISVYYLLCLRFFRLW